MLVVSIHQYKMIMCLASHTSFGINVYLLLISLQISLIVRLSLYATCVALMLHLMYIAAYILICHKMCHAGKGKVAYILFSQITLDKIISIKHSLIVSKLILIVWLVNCFLLICCCFFAVYICPCISCISS